MADAYWRRGPSADRASSSYLNPSFWSLNLSLGSTLFFCLLFCFVNMSIGRNGVIDMVVDVAGCVNRPDVAVRHGWGGYCAVDCYCGHWSYCSGCWLREMRQQTEDKAMVLCFVEFLDAKCALTALEALQGFFFSVSTLMQRDVSPSIFPHIADLHHGSTNQPLISMPLPPFLGEGLQV
ncbi:hypothetical protein Ccrd_020197 [Cynara cardunculus var. scolymus]|uniref:Nucleotide-binding, alpha-beta plait n=1 Tax=Cynara cardunculus var. scolymus TaxID=59895 RepID=A0A118K0K1_CYNCS|nr:hypothetical protein Ccrd_020197 [Cynara cardunculus var. scolymus]